jgi:hypothetical protein
MAVPALFGQPEEVHVVGGGETRVQMTLPFQSRTAGRYNLLFPPALAGRSPFALGLGYLTKAG